MGSMQQCSAGVRVHDTLVLHDSRFLKNTLLGDGIERASLLTWLSVQWVRVMSLYTYTLPGTTRIPKLSFEHVIVRMFIALITLMPPVAVKGYISYCKA